MTPDIALPALSAEARGDIRKRRLIVALAGGGYRGLFTAHVLEHLFKRFGAGSLSDQVDMFAGTSIGGIIATALACGRTPAQVKKVLLDKGQRIFPATRFRTVKRTFGKALYDPAHLRAAITAAIPDAERVKLAAVKLPLLMPAVDWGSSRMHLLASGGMPEPDALGLTLMDAMLATSAAPTYFPPHRAANHVFVDGGLVANAPDVLALQYARKLWGNDADITMISIGTASPQEGRDPVSMPGRGITLVQPLLEVVMTAQEIQAVQSMQAELGPKSYIRLNFTTPTAQQHHVGLDLANPASTQLLQALGDQCLASLGQQEQTLLKGLLSARRGPTARA
jgi:predicted acylesterase/phospholipase RssA